ncbi:MAG TPA: glycosyltransferase family A protein [Actinomycetes bacterium]
MQPMTPPDPLPRVSVVIPTRDRPSLLRRAIQSVVDQRYPGEIECVAVFDQSEPEDVEVQLPERRSLRAIVNDRTPGLAGARNAGVLCSSGELVAFCDDDDEWLQGKLAAQVEIFQTNPQAAIVACGILIRYGDREVRRLPPAGSVVLEQLLRDRLMEINPCTILVRRGAMLGPIGLVDEDIPGGYCEDYEWLLRAATVTPIMIVSRPLVRINWHTASFFADRWRTIIQALVYLLDKHPELGRNPAGRARIEGQIAFAHAALGEGGAARQWAAHGLRANWRDPRCYAALAVSTGLISAERVVHLAHSIGRGV